MKYPAWSVFDVDVERSLTDQEAAEEAAALLHKRTPAEVVTVLQAYLKAQGRPHE
jgi:hypothetical protein